MNHGIQQAMCVNFAIVWGPFGPQQMLVIWPTKAGTLEIEPWGYSDQRWVSGLGKMGLIRKYQYCLSEKLGQEQFGNLLSSSTDHLQTKMIVTTEA